MNMETIRETQKNMEPIQLAVFGAGYWGKKLCTEYLAIQETTNDVKLANVVDASPLALAAIRIGLDRYQIRFTTDYNEVLRDDSVRAVHIALPNQLHYEVA